MIFVLNENVNVNVNVNVNMNEDRAGQKRTKHAPFFGSIVYFVCVYVCDVILLVVASLWEVRKFEYICV